MLDYINERFLFAVAQHPFDVPSRETMQTNTFCSLAPLLDSDGDPVDPEDFYNCGLVWWMVRAQAAAFAEPGRLLTGVVQAGKPERPEDPYAMLYQVDFNSVEPAKASVAVEILTLDGLRVGSPHDLVNKPYLIRTDHPVTQTFFVRLRGNIYGPFRGNSVSGRSDDEYVVEEVAPESGENILEIPEEEFQHLYSRVVRNLTAQITRADKSPRMTVPSTTVRYEILVAPGPEQVRRGPHRAIEMRSDIDMVRRLANFITGRAQKKKFREHLDEVQQAIRAQGEDVPELAAADRVLASLSDDIARADQLAEAILRSGGMDDAVARSIEREVAAHVERNAAKLAGEIAERVEAEQHNLEELRSTFDQETAALDSIKRRIIDEAEAEADARRKAVEADIRMREAAIERQRTELDQQRELVSRQLSELAETFTSKRDELIREFLALQPLLEQVGMSARSSAREPERSDPRPESSLASPLAIPSYVFESEEPHPIGEATFFERFEAVVADCGFVYRRLDLIAFHVAVKTNDITILGGFSGTGKSSLVDLYARALAGTTGPQPPRFLQVWVSPSWLDSKDLLGHVNALTSDFQPAETGLFEFLAAAQKEYQRKQADSGIHLLCLDEMNLAQVEHYFSAFLQALPSSRRLPVFDRSSIALGSRYAEYATIHLAPTLRVVGTVNFDETTRQLSLRLLDRANLIRVRTGELAAAAATRAEKGPRTLGSRVSARDFRSWTREGTLRPELAAIIDKLRPHLDLLGCPITPRRYQAISRFVRSASGLCSDMEAFDLQIACRILPQVRNVYGSTARNAFDAFKRIIEESKLEEALRVIEATPPFLAEEY